jgi:hypothetical protein
MVRMRLGMADFDEVMRKVQQEAARAAGDTAAPSTPPSPPTTQTNDPPPALPTGAAPVEQPPSQPAVPATQPTPAVEQRPDPAMVQLAVLAQMAKGQQELAQIVAQMRQPAQQEPPKRKGPPSTDEVMSSFRAPLRQAGQTDADYERSIQTAVLDHMRTADREYLSSSFEEQLEQFKQNLVMEQQSALQQAAAQKAYNAELDDVVTKAGFKAGTPQADFVRRYVDADLTAAHAAGQTGGWGRTQWRNEMAARAAQVAKIIAPAAPPTPAPVAGVPPNLTLVANNRPPIGGGGSGAVVPSTPPTPAPAKAASFDEAMERVFKETQRALGKS